ncbi:MAG: hypothetical protein J4G15_13310 [Alphaproteobacteria bacterium]|nr:hypothetical protein [Alphaproteobacteria bacterium]
MTIRRTLSTLAQVIADEAERNEHFRASIEQALALKPLARTRRSCVSKPTRRRGRRTPAVLDPIEVAREGEGILRSRLETLSLEQLLDIVAQHGMDPGKLVMKWKKPDRVIDRIVEIALTRATKGDAFRSD